MASSAGDNSLDHMEDAACRLHGLKLEAGRSQQLLPLAPSALFAVAPDAAVLRAVCVNQQRVNPRDAPKVQARN